MVVMDTVIPQTVNVDNKTVELNSTTRKLQIKDEYIEQQSIRDLQQDLNILINSASASTLYDYDTMVLDIFTDANGYDGSVDTGNTTAVFNTDKYEAAATDVYGPALADSGSHNTTTITGTINAPGFFSGIKGKIGSGSGPVTITIKKGAATIATKGGTWSSTLSEVTLTSGDYNETFEAGDTYSIVIYTQYDLHTYNSSQSKSGGAFDFTSQEVNSNANSADDMITYKTNAAASFVVQTDMQTISANPAGHQVYCHNATTGSGSITYDISFDNGSTWVTGQSLNTKNTSVHNGSQMIVKLNLNTTSATDTATADDYAVMLYY